MLPREHRKDIDGLRGLAVLGTALYHAYPSTFRSGFIGVDIFFTISGFLITKILLEEGAIQGNGIFNFYLRRAIRILPALLLVLTCFLILAPYFLIPSELESFARHLIGGLFFYSNFSLFLEHGYFAAIRQSKTFLHLWSLGVEEQFYLLWPSILALFSRFQISTLKILLFLIVTSFAASVILSHTLPPAAFYLLPSRMWEILLGGILATKLLESYEKKQPQLKSILAALLFLCAGVLIKDTNGFPGAWALFPCLGTALFISAGPHAWLNEKILASRPLVFLGTVSYSFYLWQWPVLVFGNFYLHKNGWIIPAILLFISLVFATLSTFLMELPLRNTLRSIKQKKYLYGFLLIIFFAYPTLWLRSHQIIRKSGFCGANQVFRKYKDDLADFPSTSKTCIKKIDPKRNFDICLTTSETKTPDVVLLGDSHAKALYPGLSELYKKSDQELLLLGTWACPPFANNTYRHSWDSARCLNSVQLATDYILTTPSVKTVILSFAFSDLQGWKMKSENDALYSIATVQLNDFSKNLSTKGKKVILISDTSNLHISPRDCFQPPWTNNSDFLPHCPINQLLLLQEAKNREVFYSLISGTCTFHSAEVFKKNGIYFMMKEEHFLFRDSTHVNERGSKLIAQEFERSPCYK